MFSSSPTQFSHLLVAVELGAGQGVGWAVYTSQQYRHTIARPGDGDPLPTFALNFNRAELKERLSSDVQLSGNVLKR